MKTEDKETIETMIGATGSLIGQSATLMSGKTIGSVKNYKSNTQFGQWLQGFVKSELDKRGISHD